MKEIEELRAEIQNLEIDELRTKVQKIGKVCQ